MENSYWPQFGRSLLLATMYAAVLSGLALLLAPYLVGSVFTQAAFTNWDALHYIQIRDHGFSFENTAFFPLFPFVWRALGVSPIGMGVLNLLFFLSGFAVLSTAFGFSVKQQLVALSVPSLVFMGLPFSEAVFFGAGVLVLLGWRQQSMGLLALGLFLSSLTRSAAFVMVPAVILTAYLTRPHWAGFWRQAILGAGAAGAGLLLSVYLHYRDTKQWFVFFEAQKLWNNRLRWPALPLKNWGGSIPTHYEAVVWALALVATAYLIWLLFRHQVLQAKEWAPILFSLAYIAGVTAITLATKGGELVSLSRYVLATPYFLLLTVWVLRKQRITTRQLAWALLATELCWLLFGSYQHIKLLLSYSVLSAYLLVVLAMIHVQPRIQTVAFAILVPLNSGLLIWLLYRFLQNEWVA